MTDTVRGCSEGDFFLLGRGTEPGVRDLTRQFCVVRSSSEVSVPTIAGTDNAVAGSPIVARALLVASVAVERPKVEGAGVSP